MIKRILSLLIMTIMFSYPLCAIAAQNIPNTSIQTKNLEDIKIKKERYRYKTVLKYYTPYEATITNNNKTPILLNSDSDVEFILTDGTTIKSQSRREIYKRTRKRDMGRYYSFALPGALIGAGITGITFFILAPVGAVVSVAMYEPTNKAVRANVDISQELYNTADLPIRFEPSKTYPVRFYLPKKAEVKAVKINNLTLNNKKDYELIIPISKTVGGEL